MQADLIAHQSGPRTRWWFTCPKCSKRVKKLYLPSEDSRFACRICTGLIHRSAQLGGNRWSGIDPYLVALSKCGGKKVGSGVRRTKLAARFLNGASSSVATAP